MCCFVFSGYLSLIWETRGLSGDVLNTYYLSDRTQQQSTPSLYLSFQISLAVDFFRNVDPCFHYLPPKQTNAKYWRNRDVLTKLKRITTRWSVPLRKGSYSTSLYLQFYTLHMNRLLYLSLFTPLPPHPPLRGKIYTGWTVCLFMTGHLCICEI